jgi:hypothetical protein
MIVGFGLFPKSRRYNRITAISGPARRIAASISRDG